MGPEKAVDELLSFPDASAEEQDADDVPTLDKVAGLPRTYRDIRQMLRTKTQAQRQAFLQEFLRLNRDALIATADWWMKRMAGGKYPLQEKLTLFWHGHFATSAKDERSAILMWQQNELLRKHAAGNFRSFVKLISRDAAMLDYLNNTQNHKKKPNENYARELMELFTLGIGNYTEQDVKEAARAFTGWTHDGGQFEIREWDHDTGTKVFLGRRGQFDGDDIVDIIMSRAECGRFIGAKLFAYFAYEPVEDDLRNSLGSVLREKYDLRALLRVILTSKAFYSPRAMGTQVKSPIQLCVGTCRLLEQEVPDARALYGPLNQMGQVPFMPPSVKGWPSGRQWINTSTLFVRYNTCLWLAGGENRISSGNRLLDLRNRFRRAGTKIEVKPGAPAEEVVDGWVARLIQRPIEEEKRQELIDTLGRRPDDPERLKRMVQLIVTMPEYQLC
jgi:uncharacterized protein (DUF1800 family)